jgi:HAD superfamily hydrolase (TIGR01450 family)
VSTVDEQAPQGLHGTTGPLAAEHDLLILDLDGVVYIGRDAVPGAPATIETLRSGTEGIPAVRCCYLTNNASRTPDQVAEHLRALGVPADTEEVLTSAQVAAAALADRLPAGARVLVVGGAGLRAALQEEGLVPVAGMDDRPQAVVQGFSPDLAWPLLAEGTRAVRAGLLWVASNLDLTLPTAHGPAPGNGTFVAAVATAAGRDPDVVAGKPRPEPFRDAVRRTGSRRPLVVGDRLDTDLEGARAAEMPALAVLSGLVGARDLILAPAHQRPTQIGVDLTALLDRHPEVSMGLLEDGAAPRAEARCRSARVGAGRDGLAVLEVGPDPVDLLRAACAAAWSLADLDPQHDDPPPDGLGDLLDVLGRFGSARGWAR